MILMYHEHHKAPQAINQSPSHKKSVSQVSQVAQVAQVSTACVQKYASRFPALTGSDDDSRYVVMWLTAAEHKVSFAARHSTARSTSNDGSQVVLLGLGVHRGWKPVMQVEREAVSYTHLTLPTKRIV